MKENIITVFFNNILQGFMKNSFAAQKRIADYLHCQNDIVDQPDSTADSARFSDTERDVMKKIAAAQRSARQAAGHIYQ